MFAPIAIVGRACVLPGALSPEELWDAVVAGRSSVSDTPAGRWRRDDRDSLCEPDEDSTDRAWSRRGGYVRGFEDVWDPSGFGLDADALKGLDPVARWTLHVARAALADAGDARRGAVERPRTTAVFGNLGYPSAGMTEYAEGLAFGDGSGDPRNRFMAGGTASILQQALGLAPDVFCLDTACASSLYAIKLACDRLHDGSADVALAGAVACSDDLFIHVGFTALQALSKTGQTRPFHQDADGLVPGEGAGFVVLKRLEDAVADGDTIHGVLRGVGLSNDGRGRGFLAPGEEGQVRAIRSAYAQAGLAPSDVSLLEFHATGTTVGDATEIRSTATVFEAVDEVPVGSLKSNLGHLITAAGVAGLIKVLEAMRHGVRPPTAGVTDLNPALSETPLRVLAEPEPWPADRPRIAGISAFGFGGNNAHLVVSQDAPEVEAAVAPSTESIAIVGVGAVVGSAVDSRQLAAGAVSSMRTESFELDLAGLRFPPTDLRDALPQQLVLLKAAREATTEAGTLPRERTGLFVGMEPDVEVTRYGARWRLSTRLRNRGLSVDEHAAWMREAGDAIVPALTAAAVVGCMPNIPTNRINSALDLGGPGITVSEGEASGGRVIQLAMRALRTGELDAAVVGAVDLSCSKGHVDALEELEGTPTQPGDAAVALVLKRLGDAEKDGDRILAILDDGPATTPASFDAQLGRSWAAGELRDVAALVLGLDAATEGACADVGFRSAPSIRLRSVDSPPRPPAAPPTRPLRFDAHPAPLVISPLPLSASSALPLPANASSALPPPTPPAFTPPPATAARPEVPMQSMPPAPGLPPVGSDASSTPFPAAAAPSHAPSPAALTPTAPPIAAAQPAVPAPAAVAGPADPVADALRRTLAAVGATHQAFLKTQTELHQRFLTGRELAEQALVQAALGGQIASVDRSVEAVVARAPAAPVVSPSQPAARTAHAPSPPEIVDPSTHAGGARTTHAPSPPEVATPSAPIAPDAAAPAQVTSALGVHSSPPEAPVPVGPTFDFDQLATHASGRISDIFGPMFSVQDDYTRQVRMPEPPLLLADRVTGLDAEAGAMKTGTIWTESDVEAERWFMHQGHMPMGILIESGQADLMLISYMGVDFTNRGERTYRLLGCELMLHGPLPSDGETLAYDIHLDGHAAQGDVRLMFFHYDCRVDGDVRLSVRKGQAGFFTDAELDDSDGCLWTPEGQEIVDPPRMATSPVVGTRNAFTAAQVRAFSDGRPWECFGEGFERSQTHTRTPRIQGGRMLFLEEGVEDWQARGGPWGRGYLKSTVNIRPDHWFFEGHFKNDSCMPGTLMFEGALQAIAFHLAALGFTVDRDGHRFEPVREEPFLLSCRGQVTPTSKVLTYEVFVEEVVDAPVPTVYADVLCTVDGLKAFHARRVGVQLTPSWPLDEAPKLIDTDPRPVATAGDHTFDFHSLLACANGRPSQAFGEMYAPFDSPVRVARLPNPPYHFVSRVLETVGPIGSMEAGLGCVIDYDIPDDAWYFDENGARTMPFAVLLEAALQPCGWLASYTGCALSVDGEAFFRNLDGTGTLHVDLLPGCGTLRTKVTNTGISKAGSMIIVNYAVECFLGDVLVYDMTTVFGFFPAEALANQVGLPTSDDQRALLTLPGETIDLVPRPERYFSADRPRLAEPMLLMIDRITRWLPEGGDAGLGIARGEKDIDPGEWFFKAHFFQDPVQPGSLGIEAMVALLQWAMLERNMDEGIDNPRFEALALGTPMTWKYRGQVVPTNKVMTSTLEITEIGRDHGVWATATASLWVDGKRIYEASGVGMRIVSGGVPDAPVTTLDPTEDTWLLDHCPTYTRPALPMMSMVDLLAQGGSIKDPVVALKNIQVKGWLDVSDAVALTTERRGDSVRLLNGEAEVATATVLTGSYPDRPDAFEPLTGPSSDPYERLFHGPAFQLVQSLILTDAGSSSTITASSSIPVGRLNPALLDAATHGIPHDELHLWDPKLPADQVAYPALIPEMTLHAPTPTTGTVRCEVRPDGHYGTASFPAFKVQLIDDVGVWCAFRLVEACFPKGRLGSADPGDRRAFLRDATFVSGVSLSETGETTTLTEEAVAGADWLPGTIEAVYGSRDVDVIASKEHIAAAHGIHPGKLPAGLPLTSFDLQTDDGVVTGDPLGTLNIDRIRSFWTGWFDREPWPVEDLYYGLCERFVRRVVLDDPAAFEAIQGRSALFVGNHQTGVESLLFSIVASGLTQVPTVTLAKTEHQTTWLGRLIKHCFEYPGVSDPKVITFFDRTDKASLPAVMQELAAEMAGVGRSVMVHVEGTRSFDCRTPVQKMSGGFLDMAMAVGAPVVPVRFVGGLPSTPLDVRTEFPVGMGQQDIYFGRPIEPEELAALHYGDRKKLVIGAVNALGPDNAIEESIPGDGAFAAKVQGWLKTHDVEAEHAVLREVLAEQAAVCPETQQALDGAEIEDAWLAELARRLNG